MDLVELFTLLNININNNIKLSDCKKLMALYDSDDYTMYIDKYCNDNHYNANHYMRIKLKEFSNNNIEFIIIIWKPNAQSKIHDHPANGCLMRVLCGNIMEHTYNNMLELVACNNLPKNIITYIENNTTLHSISNISNEISITLHIYSPPNYISNIYN